MMHGIVKYLKSRWQVRWQILLLGAGLFAGPQYAWAQHVDEGAIGFSRPDVLPAAKALSVGSSLFNGQYELRMQADNNLVLYRNSGGTAVAVWSTGTENGGYGYKNRLVLQTDGNLALLDGNQTVRWSAGTGRSDPSNQSYDRYLRLTEDGKLVVHGDQGMPAPGTVRTDGVRFVARTLRGANQQKMCMDMTDGSTGSRTNIQLFYCHELENIAAQTFVYDTSDYIIRPRQNQSMCLDADGGTNANGVNIQLYPCNGTTAQKFVYNAATGTLSKAAASGWCIDVSGGDGAALTNIQLWTCNGSAAQKFDLHNAADAGVPIWINSLDLRKRNAINKCFDIQGGSTANGAKVGLWDCHGGTNQNFTYNKISGRFQLASTPAKCLDMPNGNTANGTQVQLYTCNTSTAQKFDFELETGVIRFRANPKKCLDVAGGGDANGTPMTIYDCNDSGAQKFNAGNKLLQSFVVDAHHISDAVRVSINGTERMYFYSHTPDSLKRLQRIDPSWLRPGDNTVQFQLIKRECGDASLGLGLFRNLEAKALVGRSFFKNQCNYFPADWQYNVNSFTGQIRHIQ